MLWIPEKCNTYWQLLVDAQKWCQPAVSEEP